MSAPTSRRALLAGLSWSVPVALAGCSGPSDGSGPDGTIGVHIDNQDDQSHELAVSVVNRDGGESLFERTVTLAADEQSTGSFDDPGEDVALGVQARITGGPRETAAIGGDQRVGLDVVRVTVLQGGSLNVSWAVEVDR